MALSLFDTELTVFSTLPDNQELSLALGNKTIVHWTSSQSLSFVGLSVSGSQPVDKMVVCFSNVNGSTGYTQTFAHESSSASSPAFRFRNAGLAGANGGAGIAAVWYQYYASQLRWIMIGKTA